MPRAGTLPAPRKGAAPTMGFARPDFRLKPESLDWERIAQG
jgi:hypothetical protein